MLRTEAARLARLTLAAVSSLLFIADAGYGQSPCSLASLLDASSSFNGGRYTLLSSSCTLLKSSTQPLTVNTSFTVRGGQDGSPSLDTGFLAGAVVFAPGTAFILENLRLRNVRFGQASFLSLLAFNASQLLMRSVEIETDCLTLSMLSDSRPANSVQGPAYLYVANYTNKAVSAAAINITCNLPAMKPAAADGDYVLVNDSLELFNALAAYATNASASSSGDHLTILATRNIFMLPALWKRANPLLVTHNVTLHSGAGVYNSLLDLQSIVNAVSFDDGVVFSLEGFIIVNAGPLRGTLQQAAIFSIPIWFFQFSRIPAAPQLSIINCTLLLPFSEYQYFKLWTVLATTEVLANEIGAQLRTAAVRMNFASSTNETLRFNRLAGTGLDMTNVTLTYIVRGVPYSGLVLDNVMVQSFGAVPNITFVPVYDLSDMMATLSAMQSGPVLQAVALCILQNITIDPQVWPAGGYNVTRPVLIVGQSNVGRMTWIDFQRVQYFVRVIGCSSDVYMYVQGMHLFNFPNGLLQSAGSTLAGSPATAAAAADLSDVSIYLTNFQGVNTCGPAGTPRLFLNQSTVVSTYTEFRLAYNMVMRSVGTSAMGSGTAVGSLIFYELVNVVSDFIYFLNVTGWGWHGFKVNLTYKCPAGAPLLYNNVYEPLTMKPADERGSLWGWQIALIVIGCVLLVALVASLVAWGISVRKRRHGVEAVKRTNTGKHSSTGSGDAEISSGGGRLGSSAGGGGNGDGDGGGNQKDTGIQDSGTAAAAVTVAVTAKGSQNGRGAGGGAGGNSGDSAAAAAHCEKPPLEVLNSMMAMLTQEMDDQHLTILDVIGQGGFGVVYRGLWKGLNVAVKTITFQDRVAGGEKAQHRAILEAAISSSLAHPNVVTTYSYDIKPLTVQGFSSQLDSPDSGNDQNANGRIGTGFKIVDQRTVLDWKLYLIQEYCDGGSLRTAILKRKFFDANKGEARMEMILDTSLELTGGFVYLHERNIIHGDLNPNNVLLKRDASKKYGAVCKIADFGLSIKMNADQTHISNMRRGTPFYTCPQILARGNMTKAADVYSMGVMMWEMYHCCMSYRSMPSGFVARENFPKFPLKAPHEFAQLVSACLDSEPSRRPTFTQLRAQLEAQLQALKHGEMRTGEEVLGPDPGGDAAHLAACQN